MDSIGQTRTQTGRRPIAAVALISFMIGTSGSAFADCRPTPEQSSVGVRALQTELMVAGLKCSADQWNAFARKFRTTIKSDADRLQTLFRKVYGKSGPTRMNTFVTQLANDASQRSNYTAESEYCQQEQQLFERVLALTSAELERFSASRTLAVPSPVTLCAPETPAPSSPSVVTASTQATPHYKTETPHWTSD